MALAASVPHHPDRPVPARRPVPYAAAALAGAVFATVFLLAVVSPIRDGRLLDTDDYMRFVQVFRFLDGGGWWDMREPRLAPPDGVVLHWSRLVDLPLAVAVAALTPMLGRASAALAAAVVVPATLLAAFLAAVAWMARPLVGRAWAPLCALVAILPWRLVIEFSPGRVDHHAWQVLLAALAAGAMLRIVLGVATKGTVVLGALALALSLWIGGEGLVLLATVNMALVLVWVQGRSAAARDSLVMSLALLATTLALLPVALPPGHRAEIACDAFSVVYAALPAFAALFWAIVIAADGKVVSPAGRLAGAAVAAVVAVGLFLALFPECRRGPYGQVDPRLAELWLRHVAEAKPVYAAVQGQWWRLPLVVLGPAGASAVALLGALRSRGRARLLWTAAGVAVASFLALAFLQTRLLSFANLFAVAPLVWAIARVERRTSARWRLAVKPVAIGLVAPIVLFILPPWATFSVGAQPAPKKCDLRAVADALSDPAGLGERPRRILAFLDHGPELLFRTKHSVLAAPFHRNAAGNLAAFDFFSAPNEAAAWRIAAAHGVELVLFCPGGVESRFHRVEEGHLFVSQVNGKEAPPAWLRPVRLPEASGALLYEVREDARS